MNTLTGPGPRPDPHAGQPVLAAGPAPEQAAATLILVHGRGATAESILPLHIDRTGARSSDAGILNLLGVREQYGRTLAWDEQLDAKLDALTLEQINTAFRRHINAREISIVKGGDFKAAKAYQ